MKYTLLPRPHIDTPDLISYVKFIAKSIRTGCTSTMITGCTGLRVVLYELHFTVSGVTLHDGSGDGGRRPLCFVQVRWTSIGHCSGPARSGCNGFSCRGRLESHLDLLRQVHDLVSLGLPSLSRRGDSANGSCGGSGGG